MCENVPTAKCFPNTGVAQISDYVKDAEFSQNSSFIISVGTNDINSIPPQELKDRYTELLLNLKDKNAKNIILVGVLPRLLADIGWRATALDFNIWLKEQAINFRYNFIDMYGIYTNDFSLYNRDCIHLNDKGKTLFAKLTLQKIAQCEASFLE